MAGAATNLPAEHVELELLRCLMADTDDLAQRVTHLRYRVVTSAP